jgi:chromatin remodeling complex protein RSC6
VAVKRAVGDSIFPDFDVSAPLPSRSKANALTQALTPSAELAAVVGPGAFTRGDVAAKVWAYIKQHNLQNPHNKREILADSKLKTVFDGKAKVSMFELNKHLAKHLK